MNGPLSFNECRWSGRRLTDGGGIQTIPTAIKFILTFCTQEVGDTKTSSSLPKSHLVKFTQHSLKFNKNAFQ